MEIKKFTFKISKTNIIIINLVVLFFILLGYFFFNHYKLKSIEIKCPNTSEKYDCWRQVLDKTLTEQGLPASFETLAKLYDTEPDFVSECHSYTHDLGEKAYQMFARHENIEMTPKASYCGYGFYHGFMETLLHSGGTIKQAQDFCAYTDVQLSAYGAKANIACYHGIGHGAVDGSDPRAWGDPGKLIEPGLKICRTISTLPSQIDQCGTGVFNSLAIALNANLYNLHSSEDPYKICLYQDKDFKKACYEQMNTRAQALSKGNFDVAAQFVINIPDKKYSTIAMEQLAPTMIITKVGQNNNYGSEVKTCRSLPKYLEMPCINGLAGGMLEFGKPDFEYVEALSFCDSLASDEAEQKSCYGYVISNSTVLYSSEKARQICSMIDSKYRTACN